MSTNRAWHEAILQAQDDTVEAIRLIQNAQRFEGEKISLRDATRRYLLDENLEEAVRAAYLCVTMDGQVYEDADHLHAAMMAYFNEIMEV